MILSVAVMGVLIAFLIFCGVTRQVDTPLYPVGISVCLFIFWLVSDVFSVIWGHEFEDRTPEQIRAYYIYAGMGLVGLGGLVHFLVTMRGMTGALVYVACTIFKRRFRDEYLGLNAEADDADAGDGLPDAQNPRVPADGLPDAQNPRRTVDGLPDAQNPRGEADRLPDAQSGQGVADAGNAPQETVDEPAEHPQEDSAQP